MLLLIKSIKICSSIEYIVCVIVNQLYSTRRKAAYANAFKNCYELLLNHHLCDFHLQSYEKYFIFARDFEFLCDL